MAKSAKTVEISFWSKAWKKVEEPLLAFISDSATAGCLWLSVGLIHMLQGNILKLGWSEETVHILDVSEEWATIISVIAFFSSQVLKYLYSLWRGMHRDVLRGDDGHNNTN